MGRPIWPRPMKPMTVISFLPSRLPLVSGQPQLAFAWREMALDLARGHVLEARRLPGRRPILVDHHRANAFNKIRIADARQRQPVVLVEARLDTARTRALAP